MATHWVAPGEGNNLGELRKFATGYEKARTRIDGLISRHGAGTVTNLSCNPAEAVYDHDLTRLERGMITDAAGNVL